MNEDISLLLLAGDIVDRGDGSNPAYVRTIRARLQLEIATHGHSEPWKAHARELTGELERLCRANLLD